MKNFILLLSILILSCSTDIYNRQEAINAQLSGEDLYSQMSQEERTMVGKWYWGYELIRMQDGTDSIDNRDWSWSDPATDTIKFYSKKFIGMDHCPEPNPDDSSLKVATSNLSVIFQSCFSSQYAGWRIEDDTLIWYIGYTKDSYSYYPILKLNNDSIVFLYQDLHDNDIYGRDKIYAIFFKQ